MKTFKQLSLLYAVIFFGFLGYALTITLYIPMIMSPNFHLLATTTSTAARATLSGLLLSAYPFGQFVGSPLIGNLSDHFGRKKILAISLTACIFGFGGIGLSIMFYSPTLLFIFSFLTGLCESNMAISQSIIVDLFNDPYEKTKFIGYAYSAGSLGYVIGPLIGGTVGTHYGFATPFFISAIGVLALAILISLQLHDNYQPDHSRPIAWLQSLFAIRTIFNQKKLRRFYLINFVIFFCVQGLYRVVPLYVKDEWNPSLHTFSLLIAYGSFLCLLANLFLLKQVTKYATTKNLLALLLVISGFCVLSIVIPTRLHWIWLTFGLTLVPTVMSLPTCTSWLSQHVDTHEQGQVLGNNQALLVLGESTSAAISGLIAAIYIPLPIIILGSILCLIGIMVYRNR